MPLEGKPTVRRHDDQVAAGPQHPVDLAERGSLVGDVLEDLVHQRGVDRRAGQRKVIGAAVVFHRIRTTPGLGVVDALARDRLVDPGLFRIDPDGLLDTPRDQRLGVAAVGAATVEPDALQQGEVPELAEPVGDVATECG